MKTKIPLSTILVCLTGNAFALTAPPAAAVGVPALGPLGWGALLALLAGAGFVTLKRRKK